MRRSLTLSLLLVAALSSACSKREAPSEPRGAPAAPAQLVAAPAASSAANGGEHQAEGARKVIRKADLTLESEDPAAASPRAAAVAARYGGFVVSSEVRQATSGEAAHTTAVIVLRVPSIHFDAALAELRGVGVRAAYEKITGQDVTEEVVDLDARLRASRAIEAQYLVILKDAKSVRDALDVQQKLGEIRTEIERQDGRRRWLEDQTQLSTLTVTIIPSPLVRVSSFGIPEAARQAAGDLVSVSAAIVTGGIRLFGVLVPILVLVVLPIALIVRALRRRHLLAMR